MDDAGMAMRHSRATASREAVWGVAGILSAVAVLGEGDVAAGGPWGACGSGSRWPLGSFGLFVGVLIAAGAVQAAAWVLAYRLITALAAHHLAAAIAVVAVCAGLLLLLGWGLLAVFGLPVSYGEYGGGYPQWWPDWLPPHAGILPCRPPE
jgi:hypothetical protein